MIKRDRSLKMRQRRESKVGMEQHPGVIESTESRPGQDTPASDDVIAVSPISTAAHGTALEAAAADDSVSL